jgi:hypothetical protein
MLLCNRKQKIAVKSWSLDTYMDTKNGLDKPIKYTAPNPPRLSFHQEELLEAIRFAKEELQKEIQRLYTQPNKLGVKAVRYQEGAEFSRERRLRKDIDNLTVKAIRSLWKRIPGTKGYPGICMKFGELDKESNYEVFYVPGDAIEYHPGIPRWALSHMSLWVHEKRHRAKAEDFGLLAACKMGLETGLRHPADLDLLKRVLRARGVEINSGKVFEKLSRQRTNQLKGKKSKRGRPRKRVRNDKNSWDQIASRLAKEVKKGSIPTTGEGLKILLQKMWPDIDFDKV